jgi:hypothetical protein
VPAGGSQPAPRISGVTIARGAVGLGYPVAESLVSMLPAVDEIVANIGDCADGTREAVIGVGAPELKLLEDPWDDTLRRKGLLLSCETNRAFDAATGDWVLYLQADEVLHEDDAARIRPLVASLHDRVEVDGVSFRYLHFYGGYGWVQDNPFGWYRRAVRLVRRIPAIRSVGDALKFRRLEAGRLRRLRAVRSDLRVFHYGWARSPAAMALKQRHLERYWKDDVALARDWAGDAASRIFSDTRHLVPFHGSHPASMARRIAAADWTFEPRGRSRLPRWLRLVVEAFRRPVARWLARRRP